MIIIQSKVQKLLVFNKLFDRIGLVEQSQGAFDQLKEVKPDFIMDR